MIPLPNQNPADQDVYHHDFHASSSIQPKPSIWRRLGGGSLSVSLMIHGIILAIGLFLIIQVIPQPPPPAPDITPHGGGNGSPSVKSAAIKRVPSMTRIVSNGPSDITLPEVEITPVSALPALATGNMGTGLHGNGPGKGTGPNAGDGSLAGMTGSGPSKIPVFGRTDPTSNALVGTFYDLKQDRSGKPTPIGRKSDWGEIMTDYRSILYDFTKRGWNERQLNDYFQAPQKLYQTKIFMPSMDADAAPKAFNQNNISGSRWVVVYRGSVTPPKTGCYRFVGAGDDVLAVRFAGKTVFDFGYESATANISLARNKEKLASSTRDRDWEHERKDLAMPEPVQIRRYPGLSARHSTDIWGLAVGQEFEAKAGAAYPIEILVGETPGGFFFGYLLIEEIGAEYQKTPEGDPILPLFRLDNEAPAVTAPGPPFDPNGPVWKLSGDRGKMNI